MRQILSRFCRFQVIFREFWLLLVKYAAKHFAFSGKSSLKHFTFSGNIGLKHFAFSGNFWSYRLESSSLSMSQNSKYSEKNFKRISFFST